MPDEILNLTRLKHCMMKVEVLTHGGDYSIGSAFHIGDGYVVTAKHVIENKQSFRVIPEQSFEEDLQVLEVFTYPDDQDIDIAVLKTNFDGNVNGTIHYGEEIATFQPHFELCPSYDDWVDGFQLVDIVLLGYPLIPRTNGAFLVAMKGHINAAVDRYDGKHPHFIISCTARGGFSGAPCLLASDFSAIGICTRC